MIAATYTQGQGLRIEDVPTPSVENGDMLVRVAARLIASGRIDVNKVISHNFSFAQMELPFEQAMRQEAMKVVLESGADSAEATRG